jgi:hypothetical protein
MKRGDVDLVRFPHPSGQRGKKATWCWTINDNKRHAFQF